MGRPIAIATLICGSLDILFAMILTVTRGGEIGNMLRSVASGPFPSATGMGTGGAVLGLAVHFALMAIMAAVFMIIVSNRRALLRTPYRTGMAYGVITYFIMNWIVVPLRFDPPMPLKPMQLATQLFAHIVLVGIPFALIASRHLKRRTFS
jgi:hypothetical protein